jgi:DUF971 family protein
MNDSPKSWPTELRLNKAKDVLHITYEDGATFELRAEYLRVESPSAEVQGHGSGNKTIVTGKSGVGIKAIEPVGNYAARLVFDDGHDTGLFTWAYLRKLGQEEAEIWAAYIAARTNEQLGSSH